MTDDLIARLRDNPIENEEAHAAAAALEAQARRIAELEERHDECFRIWDNYRIETNARIAELEAENKKLRTELDWAKYCYDDLRAALEKKDD